jgi:hypothetical protein
VRALEAALSIARGEQGHAGHELVASFRFAFTSRILGRLIVALGISSLGLLAWA